MQPGFGSIERGQTLEKDQKKKTNERETFDCVSFPFLGIEPSKDNLQ